MVLVLQLDLSVLFAQFQVAGLSLELKILGRDIPVLVVGVFISLHAFL